SAIFFPAEPAIARSVRGVERTGHLVRERSSCVPSSSMKCFSRSRTPDRASRWAPLPLRLIVGFGFVAHGYAKLAKGPEAFVAIVQAIGVPAPYLMAWFTIGIELLGSWVDQDGGRSTALS